MVEYLNIYIFIYSESPFYSKFGSQSMIQNSAKLSCAGGVDAGQIVAGSLHIYGVTSLASLTFSPSSLSMIADSSSTLMSLKDLSAF